jgi:hypothetical protein
MLSALVASEPLAEDDDLPGGSQIVDDAKVVEDPRPNVEKAK